MAQLVTIPISFVELTISYERPNIKAFNDRAALVQAIFDSLLPWNPKLDDVEPRTSGKLSEQGFSFRLPLKQISFFGDPPSAGSHAIISIGVKLKNPSRFSMLLCRHSWCPPG